MHQNKVHSIFKKKGRCMSFLGQITKEDFLQNYWEKKPLFIKNAVKNAPELVKLSELLELASDEYFESSAISKVDNEWKVEEGPFSNEKFLNKDESWTLILHNLDLYFQKLHDLRKEVDFLPRWLFDDVMSTYSTKGSSVGAHIDTYNVFIIQAMGSREWQLELNPNKEYQKDLPIRLLKEFNINESYILEPGDMIYLPPHIGHHGISQSESLSFSIGFKSIEYKPLMDQLCLDLVQFVDSNNFYKTDPKMSEHLITDKMVDGVRSKLIEEFITADFVKDQVANLLTTPKRYPDPTEEIIPLHQGKYLKDEFTLFVGSKKPNGKYLLSINGEPFEVNETQYLHLEKILLANANEEIETTSEMDIDDLLTILLSRGILYPCS